MLCVSVDEIDPLSAAADADVSDLSLKEEEKFELKEEKIDLSKFKTKTN